MLNRFVVVKDIEYIFNNIDNLNVNNVYDFMINNKYIPVPDDMNKEVNKVYNNILLNEKYKDIKIEDQILMFNEFIDIYKKHLIDNNLFDKFMQTKIFLLDLEIPILIEFLKLKINVINMKKGFR